MENARFQKIVGEGMAKLTAVLSPLGQKMIGGQPMAYNAYFNGTEVVVLGYQFGEDGHTITKPLAIFVDEEVFSRLRVDDEAGRNESDPPKVI